MKTRALSVLLVLATLLPAVAPAPAQPAPPRPPQPGDVDRMHREAKEHKERMAELTVPRTHTITCQQLAVDMHVVLIEKRGLIGVPATGPHPTQDLFIREVAVGDEFVTRKDTAGRFAFTRRLWLVQGDLPEKLVEVRSKPHPFMGGELHTWHIPAALTDIRDAALDVTDELAPLVAPAADGVVAEHARWQLEIIDGEVGTVIELHLTSLTRFDADGNEIASDDEPESDDGDEESE